MKRFNLEEVPSDIQKKLAENHKKLRKRKKLSQAETAKKSGVSLGSLKRFEQTGHISLISFLKLLHFHGNLSLAEQLLNVPLEHEEIEQLFSDKTRPQK